jgi:hypothetical protein
MIYSDNPECIKLFSPIFSHVKTWCRKLLSSDKVAMVATVTTKWQHPILLMDPAIYAVQARLLGSVGCCNNIPFKIADTSIKGQTWLPIQIPLFGGNAPRKKFLT